MGSTRSDIEIIEQSLNVHNIGGKETSPRVRSAKNTKQKNMKQKGTNELQDEHILAGLKFKMQYLGCSEELKLGGTDHEIANVIHDIHTLYAGRSGKLSKARNVVVFVDAEKIIIFDKTEDDILLTFPLVYVKDVTVTCRKQGAPYTKTCVVVAKDYNDPLYKAFVFYCKKDKLARDFYDFTTKAFQLGFKRLENDSLHSASTANEESFESSSNFSPNYGSFNKPNAQLRMTKNDQMAGLDNEDGGCDSLHDFKNNPHEMQRLLDSGQCNSEVLRLKSKEESQSKNSSQRQREIKVSLSSKPNSFTRYEKQEIKFNLNLGEGNNNENSSKINTFVDTVGESSSYFIPHWLRNSCRKFRKMSTQRPANETAEDV